MIRIRKSLPVLLWLGVCGMVFGCTPKGENKVSAKLAAADTTEMVVDSARIQHHRAADGGYCLCLFPSSYLGRNDCTSR